MKGIILAGGAGSRLYPMSLVASKQLQPVYDKPMVYYPLTTLLEAGIRDIAVISTPHDLPRFRQLLGDGKRLGIRFTYIEQVRPEGIAQAFLLAESFIGNEPVALILGDNIFYGATGFNETVRDFTTGATVFGYSVRDPERYGVIALDAKGKVVDIIEKPKAFVSPYAVPGFYVYDNSVVARTRKLQPSPRGELEITDLNKSYLADGQLHVHLVPRGVAWLDAGTSSSLHDASAFIQAIEKRQSIKIGCPEEAAYRRGFISDAEFAALIASLPNCEYRAYLEETLNKPF
ncbi:MAG: glucose-1-phosphate thymidylyltransferase [Verrucomicrobia bacterium Tous-C9LFEB]|nr:MAG: glucose-1-phosphate thymidylyltransferase [Verrucomicrobia bacterium Tous-C9LFEB]